ncbi:BtrH N-terminal domain-containing protein [Paenibacillus sp.]|jgi:KaiC/GvpD/RAD55 family RecA-like ATPase|uniref:BtrH N-terminal domain-containing protein n=1 Tax=Paenibacillus sp. TaxID=58172 RepID=UPI0028385142|nr:BtrH N-terminal domain-containing protein [Paenibacillus sp.]MDR0267468.1 hypothetical protein [Paenibacillus sp.]
MSTELYTHPYHSCLTISAAGVLHKVLNISQLWHVRNLFAFGRTDGGYSRFFSKDIFFSEEITAFSGGRVDYHCFTDYGQFEAKLTEELALGRPAMVPVDTYFLPYSHLYQKEHNHHWVVFLQELDNTYQIADHYFHKIAELDKSSVQQLMEGFLEIHHINKYQAYTFHADSFLPLDLHSYRQAIEYNLKAMKSKDKCGKQVSYLVLDYAYVEEQGMDVFKLMFKKIEEDAARIHELSTEYLEDYYHDFLEISNTSFLFSEFIDSIEEELEGKQELVQLLRDLAHDYRLLSNLGLKATVDRQKSFSKIAPRLQLIYEKETLLLTMMEAYINQPRLMSCLPQGSRTVQIPVARELDIEQLGQIEYSLRFLFKEITSVTYDSLAVRIEHTSQDDSQMIPQIEKIISRMTDGRMYDFKNMVVFTQSMPTTYTGDILEELLGRNIITQTGLGIYSYHEPFSLLLSFLDDMIVQEIAKPLGAKLEKYPSIIHIDTLNKTNHFLSFPQHIHFLSHLNEDIDHIDQFAKRAAGPKGLTKEILDESHLKSSLYVKNPAICYHCYQTMQNTQMETAGRVITSVGSCNRYESNNHAAFGRLFDFTMREVIFVGTDEYVRQMRARSIELLKSFVETWGTDCYLENANDPFFTNDHRIKASFQRVQEMKYEMRFRLPASDSSLAVCSSNYHGNVFGRAFGITAEHEAAFTGCLAFGLERWVLAFLAQFGLDMSKWPKPLAQKYTEWLDQSL